MAAAGRVARVVIDSPLPQLDHFFDYLVPDELAAEAQPGVRVRVPLRTAGRVADGYLVELAEPDEAFEGALSPLEAVVSPVPVLTTQVWTLARRLADRSAGTASDILRLAAYELAHTPDVPTKVVINEAVELAKRFGAAEAPAFVNGILDRIAQVVRKGEPEAPQSPPADAE